MMWVHVGKWHPYEEVAVFAASALRRLSTPFICTKHVLRSKTGLRGRVQRPNYVVNIFVKPKTIRLRGFSIVLRLVTHGTCICLRGPVIGLWRSSGGILSHPDCLSMHWSGIACSKRYSCTQVSIVPQLWEEDSRGSIILWLQGKPVTPL